MDKINKSFFVVIPLMLVLFACGPKEVYHSVIEIPEEGWHMDSVAVFNSKVDDLDDSFHILVETQNKDQYRYSNLWLFIDAISPSGHKTRDTLECRLADKTGKWYGKSHWGDGYTQLHPYKMNIKFPEKGVYKFYLAQGMRDTVIYNLKSIGIEIIKED